MVLNAGLSRRLGLALERPLLVAATRTAVQLFLVGFVIKALFALDSPLWTGLMALVMILAAGYEVHARQTRRFTGVWAYGLGALSVAAGAGLVTLLALSVVVQPKPWYQPRYAVPLPGMMTGQILASADPVEAVKCQILIMFLIAGGTGIGVFLAVTIGTCRFSDPCHRSRLDRLKAAD